MGASGCPRQTSRQIVSHESIHSSLFIVLLWPRPTVCLALCLTTLGILDQHTLTSPQRWARQKLVVAAAQLPVLTSRSIVYLRALMSLAFLSGVSTVLWSGSSMDITKWTNYVLLRHTSESRKSSSNPLSLALNEAQNIWCVFNISSSRPWGHQAPW